MDTTLCSKDNNPLLCICLEKAIKPAVQDTSNSLLSEMKSHRDLLEKHSTRLVQVRQDKVNKINNPNFGKFITISELFFDLKRCLKIIFNGNDIKYIDKVQSIIKSIPK